MSLILEALRKSEAERRRGQAPDVATELAPVALARRAATPPWILPVAVVVVLALLAAAWWARRERNDAADARLPAAATDAEVDATVAPVQDVAVEAPPVVAARPQAAPVATSPVVPTPAPSQVVVLDDPPPRDVQPPPTVPPPPPLPAPAAAGSMPSVKLSMHMWNESPSGRFVILNGQRMVEGDRSGDLTVVAIERDGVIVERNGQRARVPLP